MSRVARTSGIESDGATRGRWCARGARVLSCLAAAFLALVLAAAQGAFAQSLSDGIDAYRQGDYQRARDIWLPLAEAGDAVAQFNLGKLYEFGGGGLAKDHSQAVRWYREASAQGVAAAENNLGLMYAQGLGVPRDLRRAAELWKKASEAGYGLAQYNLGLAYFRGEGVPRDERLAAVWFHKSAEAGLADAQYAIGQLIRMGRVMARDDGLALTWYDMAAAQGHAEATLQAEELRRYGVVPKPISPLGLAMTGDAPAPGNSFVAGADQPAMPGAPSDETARRQDTAIAELAPPPPKPETPAAFVAQAQAAQLAAVPAAPTKPATSASLETVLNVAPAQDEKAAAAPEETVISVGSLNVDEARAAAAQSGQAGANGSGLDTAAGGGQLAARPDPAAGSAGAAGIAGGTGSGGGGIYQIWLFSAYSQDAAKALWVRARNRHAAVLGSVKVSINEVDYGEQGKFYRVMAGPLKTAYAAQELCRQIRIEDPYSFCKILTP